MKMVDLNVPTEDSPSEPLPLQVAHQDHKSSAAFMASFFEATVDDLPDGNGWANDTVTMISHAGTHVDAPWHYYPTCGGKRARTIDELPLDWTDIYEVRPFEEATREVDFDDQSRSVFDWQTHLGDCPECQATDE